MCLCLPLAPKEKNGHTATCNYANRRIVKDSVKAATKVAEKKSIRKVSDKRKKDLQVYANRRKHHLTQYPECQLKLDGCTKVATQIHHAAGRIGSNLTNKNHFRSACQSCHRQLHDKISAKEARKKGLKV